MVHAWATGVYDTQKCSAFCLYIAAVSICAASATLDGGFGLKCTSIIWVYLTCAIHTLVKPLPLRLHSAVHMWCFFFSFFFLPSIQMSDGHFQVKPQWYRAILSLSFASFLCDWINYVSLTLLEVSKHTFSVISHQSMWPWRWKVKHVSQEAGQRGIRQLISGPTQSHHSTLAGELKLSLLAMYSEL